jgi:signal transduction histidine kinase
MPDEKKKLQWLLWGLTIGPAPFLLLEILPELFIPLSPVPEEFTLVFFLAIPTSFAVSFVRYHLLDVQVVINRTTVYGIVIAILVAFYVVLVALTAYLVGSYTLQASTVAAILIALGFEPLRRKVQLSVDKRFFRVRYDFRQAQRMFAEEMNRQPDLQALATFVTGEFQKLVPVETVACCTVQEDGRLRVVAEHPERSLDRFPDFLTQAEVWAAVKRPVMLPTKIEMGVSCQPADPKMFERWGLSMVFPMHAQGGRLLGVLAVGGKKSGARFSSEDVDLLVNIATQTGLEIERIILQQEVIRKEAEAQRQKELNELKSEFVSYVSHEFRTPLTSIKLYADLLGSRQIGRDTKSKEFLRVIEGESDRLDRMVTTILDSAKIERGSKEYRFVVSDLGELAREVLRAMSYQLRKEGFRLQTVGLSPRQRHPVRVDHDAVVESLTNLMANAIKYSEKRKKIRLIVVNDRTWVRCSVEDQGRGISPEVLPHIFEKFYRAPSSSFEIEGVGLGLTLAKSIMEAHGGRIEVESTLGKGSRFHLLFPRIGTGHLSGAKAGSRHRR